MPVPSKRIHNHLTNLRDCFPMGAGASFKVWYPVSPDVEDDDPSHNGLLRANKASLHLVRVGYCGPRKRQKDAADNWYPSPDIISFPSYLGHPPQCHRDQTPVPRHT
ncbi:hypothetical protein GQ607_011939 [Colletotrichum asianum]|uniref:Uncharacterized protein n=1 Tax=Colletotrichum asianum TaxID=702518 RepID=A0A8H3W7H6_9PEZI|nr:hypothetical protein GQ607_011939 [Colletotrichum asianum]